MLATFSAILRISRLESGAYRRSFAQTNVVELVRDIYDLYRAAAEERGAQIRFETGPGGEQAFCLSADRELLAQAFTNIVDNALKYCGSPGLVTIRVDTDEDSVTVAVSDNGPGIPAEDRDRITERFVRLDAARDLPGTGLGLTLVKAVVEAHRGRLVFDDRGPGLVVTVSLPRRGSS